jgi:hypothetical protein
MENVADDEWERHRPPPSASLIHVGARRPSLRCCLSPHRQTGIALSIHKKKAPPPPQPEKSPLRIRERVIYDMNSNEI